MMGLNVEAAIVSNANLLANDMLGGFVGANLTLTGVSNFSHFSEFGSGHIAPRVFA